MERECKLLFFSRLNRFVTLMRQTDPSLFNSGPLANLKRVLLGDLEAEERQLVLIMKKKKNEEMILQILNNLEKRADEHYAELEFENSKLHQENGELSSKYEKIRALNEEFQAEIANLKAHISIARGMVGKIIEDFESVIKDPDKLKSALKIIADILDSPMEEPAKPRGYRYNVEVIKIAILTIVHARCSFRSAVAVLGIFQKYLPYLFKDKTPAYTTIRYWVIKSGLALAPLLKKRISGRYIFIVDESIVLNKQKMLVILAAPVNPKKGRAISFRDVSIAHMEVRENWNNDDIAKVMKRVAANIGRDPMYVVSDEGTNIKPAVEKCGWKRHRDIGHSIATMLKDIYEKDERFVDFKKDLGSLKNLTLSEAAPFAPPKERSWARWLNITPSIEWAKWMLKVYGNLDDTCKEKFEKICTQDPGIVTELKYVIDCVNAIMQMMKTRGLCKSTIEEAKKMLDELPRYFRGTLMIREKMIDYLEKEGSLLENEKDCHSISSDIIESYFSVVKRIMPNAKFFGFTEYSLGMYTRLFVDSPYSLDYVDMIGMLGATSMKDISKWCDENLVDSAYDKKTAFNASQGIYKKKRKTKKAA